MNKLKQIQEKCKGAIHLTINQHKSYYESVEEYLKGLPEALEDLEPEILDKIKELDILIELQFYPHTPIGFCRVLHYDLEMALDEALEILENE